MRRAHAQGALTVGGKLGGGGPRACAAVAAAVGRLSGGEGGVGRPSGCAWRGRADTGADRRTQGRTDRGTGGQGGGPANIRALRSTEAAGG